MLNKEKFSVTFLVTLSYYTYTLSIIAPVSGTLCVVIYGIVDSPWLKRIQ